MLARQASKVAAPITTSSGETPQRRLASAMVIYEFLTVLFRVIQVQAVDFEPGIRDGVHCIPDIPDRERHRSHNHERTNERHRGRGISSFIGASLFHDL